MKKAIVTGASSGFGKAIATVLLEEGYEVYGLARREDKLESVSDASHFHPVVLDVTDKLAVKEWWEGFDPSGLSLLVNNAGLALGAAPIGLLEWDDIETVIRTNVVGLTHLTWLVTQTLESKQSTELQIINMGSIAGTYAYPNNNVYGASKAFVNHLSDNIRADYVEKGLRVTSIEPGLARTEFATVRFKGDVEKESSLYAGARYIEADDIASIVRYLVKLPSHLNINRIEIMPTSQSHSALRVERSAQ